MVGDDVEKFLLAARDGDLGILSSEKVTDSLQDDQGATCLHYAARGGCLPAVEFLANTKGLNPRKRSNVGAIPLHDAAATGSLAVLKWLLDNTDNRVDDQDGTGATVAHLSARYGHAQLLEWLMDETDCDFQKKSASGALPLHFAAEGGHLECVKVLVAENPRSINMQMSNGSTSAYLACQMGHLPVAEFLATKNGTPKIHTFDGMSPLHAAAQTGQLHMVKWLVKDQGLNPNERDFDGATPLHYAASQGHSEVVLWLLKEGGARIILDNLGGSPLHNAAQFGQNKVVLSLLQNGCSRDITDNEGLTAEELAEKCGQTTTVAILRGEITTLPDSEPATPIKASPPQPQAPSSKPPAQQPSRYTAAALPSSHTTQVYTVRGQNTSSSAQRGFEAKQGDYNRPISTNSAASSASSFGYFSPNGGGKTEIVSVDVYDSPDKTQKGYLCNSQETGEKEFCNFSSEPLCLLTAQDKAAGASFTAKQSSSSGASVSSGASSAASTLSSTSPRSNISTDSGHRVTRITYTQEKRTAPSASPAGAAQPVLRSETTTLPASRKMDGGDTSQSPKMNGQATGMNGTGSGSNGSLGSQGNAKSVIKISSKNVTIISTGKNSSMAPKVTTTPLRRSEDDLPAMGAVSQRKKDNEFISTLSQKLQVNGPSNSVRPASVPLASRGSNSSLTEKGPDSETKPANFGAILEDKLSGGNFGSKPSSQALTNNSHNAHKRQQGPSEATPPAPAVLVNGHSHYGSSVDANGVSGSSSGQITPVSIPPPPPPPAPIPDSIANNRASNGFKADASYEGTRPKSLSTQSSANSSIPSSPRGNGGTPEQQKHDLMAALHAVVTSGSASASLRKTRGPPAGGIKEVFASKKTSGDSSPTMEKQVEKQAGPALLPPVDEFDWKIFLAKIPKTDASGNQVPDWKRQMLAKAAAQKAHTEYLEKKKVDDYEARFVNMPTWKRALIEKKDVGGK